jgi:pseudouridine kinase
VTSNTAPVICIGGAVLDRVYTCTHEPALGTSNPVSGRRSFGGVARNVAETLARLDVPVSLISAAGADDGCRAMVADLQRQGVDVSGLLILGDAATAEYTAAFHQGELFAAFADMAVFDALKPGIVLNRLPERIAGRLVFADCNLPAETLEALRNAAHASDFTLVVDAVSIAKSERLPATLAGIGCLFVNAAQARHLASDEDLGIALDRLGARGARCIVLTNGPDGITFASEQLRAHLPAPAVSVVNVSGAGDATIAGVLYAFVNGGSLPGALSYGIAAASLALQSDRTVPTDLTRARLEARRTELFANED